MKPWIASTALALFLVAGAAEAQTGGAAGAGVFGGRHGGGAVRQACQADIEQLCANTEPGGGRIIQCLRDHQDRVSNACKSAMASARAGRRDRPSTPPSPEPAPTQPPPG